MQQQLDPATRAALEAIWRLILGILPHLAAVLGKPNPIVSRAERLAARRGAVVE
jgi:hypothetical protein